MKPKDKILQIGCGNSTLAEQLYDSAFRNMCNIDLNATVIKQMKKRNAKNRPGLHFEAMDATNLAYDKDTFNVVLDKGTVDALFSAGSEHSADLTKTNFDSFCESESDISSFQLFSETERVLMASGRFVCVTLAQPIVLRRVLCYFLKKSEFSYIVRMHHVKLEKSFDMPTFCLVLFKMKAGLKLPTVFETDFGSGSAFKCKTADQFLVEIESFQKLYFLSRKVTSLKGESSGSVFTDMMSSEGSIRYRCYVVNNQNVKKPSYAVFVCPQFGESENIWLYLTSKGRMELVCSHIKQYSRVLLVMLNPLVNYGGLDSIKGELSSSVMAFAPDGLPASFKTPFLSMGTVIGSEVKILTEFSTEKTDDSLSIIKYSKQTEEETNQYSKQLISNKNPFNFICSLNFEDDSDKLTAFKSCELSDFEFLVALVICNIDVKIAMTNHKFSVNVFGIRFFALVAFFDQILSTSIESRCFEKDKELIGFVKEHFVDGRMSDDCLAHVSDCPVLNSQKVSQNKMKADAVVLDSDWLFSVGQSDESDEIDAMKLGQQLLTQISDSLLPTGCVLMRLQDSQSWRETNCRDVTFEEMNELVMRMSKSVFTHVAVVKMKKWEQKLLILSQSSLKSLNVFDCGIKFFKSQFSFNPEQLQEIVEVIKFL